MASAEAHTTFEASFDNLVNYIEKSVSKTNTLEIPASIVQPFKRATQPVDSCIVRALLKLFDGTKQSNALKLEPTSFSGIVSIVFHLPHSVAQEKLLCIFLGTIKSQHNGRNEFISKRLLHTLLKRLVSNGTADRLRWIAAQFIAVLVAHPSSRDRLRAYSEFQYIQSLLVGHEDYVTRFLVADIIRTLCAHGSAIEDFFAEGTATQTILSFPQSVERDATWLRKLQDFFSDLEVATVFTGTRHFVSNIVDVAYDDVLQLSMFDPGLLIIAEHIVLLSAADEYCLQIASVPFLQDPQMTPVISEENHTVLNITFSGDSGYQLQGGTKRALNRVSLRFASDDETAAALHGLLAAQKSVRDPALYEPADRDIYAQHQSVAFLNLWTDEDAGDDDRGQRKESQELVLHDKVSSPLQQISPRRSTGTARPSFDNDTASETSFLEAQQTKSSLADRFSAAQDTLEHAKTSLAFTGAADRAVERSRSKPAGHLPDATIMEGAIDTPPHLLSQPASKSRPLPPITRDSAPFTAKKTLVPRVDSAFDPTPLPRLEPRPSTEWRPLADKPAHRRTRYFSPSPAKPEAGGPMARLAATKPQAIDQTKVASPSVTGLKRKAQPAARSRRAEDVDWDESFRETQNSDIPEDTSHDDRLAKKAKRRGSRVAAKKGPVCKQKTRSTKQTKHSNPPQPAGTKVRSKAATRLQEQVQSTTLAATRQRRTAKKRNPYEESSGSIAPDPVSELDENAYALVDAKSGASKAVNPVHSLELIPKNPSVFEDVNQHQEDAVRGHSSSQRLTDVDDDAAGHPPTEERDKVDNSVNNAIDEEVAHDSYPLAALGNTALKKTRASFGTQLISMLQSPPANKENVSPDPSTPFGDKSLFVDSVNAAKRLPPVSVQRPRRKAQPATHVTGHPKLGKPTLRTMEHSGRTMNIFRDVDHDVSGQLRPAEKLTKKARDRPQPQGDTSVGRLSPTQAGLSGPAHERTIRRGTSSALKDFNAQTIHPMNVDDDMANVGEAHEVSRVLEAPVIADDATIDEDLVRPMREPEDHSQSEAVHRVQGNAMSQQSMVAWTSFAMLSQREIPVAPQQFISSHHLNEASGCELKVSADAASSQKDDESDSDYEESEGEDDLVGEDAIEGADIPAAILVSEARSPIAYCHIPPNKEDKELLKSPRRCQPNVPKQSSRTSIGLQELLDKNFPEADTTILANRSQLLRTRTIDHAAEAVNDQDDATADDANVQWGSQKLVPPSKAGVSNTRDRQSSHSKAGPRRSDANRRTYLSAITTPPRRVCHIQPMRVRSTELCAPPAAQCIVEQSSTPLPLHLRLEPELRDISRLAVAPKVVVQRGSYAAEDSADPTLLDNTYFRRRFEASDSSDKSGYGQGCDQGEHLQSLQPEAGNPIFKRLQSGLQDVLWQMVEDSLCRLYKEQNIIEKQDYEFAAAGASAVGEMRSLWANKINYERRKAYELLKNNKIQLEEAVQKMKDDKDWWTMLRVDQIGGLVEKRGNGLRNIMQGFRKEQGI